MVRPIRINKELYESAKIASTFSNRTISEQVEFWTKLGRAAIDNPNLKTSYIVEVLASMSDKTIDGKSAYTLDELLAQWDPKMSGLIKDDEWLEAQPIGKGIC